MTSSLREASARMPLSTALALGNPWASHGLQPITTSRSVCSTSSAVWQLWPPKRWPFTQKSPVFSWESAPYMFDEPIARISDTP